MISTRSSVRAQTSASTRSGEKPAVDRSKSLVNPHIWSSSVANEPTWWDFALLVERRHRLGPHNLAAIGAHGRIADVWVDHTDCRLDHVTTVVHLGDNAVRLVFAIERDRDSRPFGRRIAAGLIVEHVTVTGRVFPSDNDAGFIGFLAA